MVKIIFTLSVFVATSQLLNPISLGQTDSDSPSLRVVILRHAEKPAEGDNLSCQGLNRALALADVLYKKFKLPDHIFVPSIKTGKTTDVARMYQTIVPFAVKHNLPIDTKFDVGSETALAQAILKKTGTLLVVWEHDRIPNLVRRLGIKEPALKWKGTDYDSIWIVTFKKGKARLNFDKENLAPPGDCK
jgi:hypothetical protein